MNTLLTFIAVALSIRFLIRRFVFPKKKTTSCGVQDCGCH
ncbi:MAG: FeoB-associated Cys-rich membrane protein [Flavobacteriaceae bacterium]